MCVIEGRVEKEDSTGGPGGMDLRDWFAGQALSRMDLDNYSIAVVDTIVFDCYAIAEALIVEKHRTSSDLRYTKEGS